MKPTISAATGLNTPVESLDGVGAARARLLRSLGVNTLHHLIEYFPRTYQLEHAEGSVAQLKPGQIHTVRGEVVAVDYISHGRARFEATIADGTDRLAAVWFNGGYLRRVIRPGMTLRLRGKVGAFHGIPQMTNPKFEQLDTDDAPSRSARFKPVYPATSALSSEHLATIIDRNLDGALAGVDEWYDPALLQKRKLVPRRDAYRMIHRAGNWDDARQARRRLVYDELMLMQLGLGLTRRLRDGRVTAPVMRIDKLLDQRIRARFPFTLTDAQHRAVWEICHDLKSGQPMHRLLQGDVGSGKTIVALYAMLVAIANKLQAAILAPTEVLAEQHYVTLSRLLADSQVTLDLFTSRTRRETRRKNLELLSGGVTHIAIGTQALIQQDIEFANLGLVVVDEQHRLGVRQRAVLKGKGYAPHYLVMTATPIPRTLALSYFADFDVTTIDELPAGRLPISTKWITSDKSLKAYELIRREASAGRQTYVVVSQIDDGIDDTKSVSAEFERLSRGPLHGLRVAMLHGQMPPADKLEVMTRFRDGSFDVLVATTVIEVGVDVPTATVMLIENADRFGLSQLHQLRGRVGRGTHESHCILVSDATTPEASQRLRAMESTSSGFEIAEMDLKLRGPGVFFGTRQHGLPEMKLADIAQEIDMLKLAKEDATAILAADPRLSARDHVALRAALVRQFGDSIKLAQVG